MVQTAREMVAETLAEWVQCDQCSARAAVEVVLPYGELTFCMHHYNNNAVALTDQGGIARLLGIGTTKNGNV